MSPPDILLTTPEQFALLIAARDARRLFAIVRAVVLDELHAYHNSKRGDLLALGLARLSQLAPGHRRIGLSATVADPAPLQRFLVPQPPDGDRARNARERRGRRASRRSRSARPMPMCRGRAISPSTPCRM